MRRALLIESNLIVALDMELTLKSIGYIVESATDTVEGLMKIEQNVYDVIFFNDVPQIDGEKFYKKVSALNEDLAKRIIFILWDRKDFIKSTGNLSLKKPFTRVQLIEAVKKLAP